MFADSLLDSGWSDRSRRHWTTLISFVLQSLAVSCLLLLPLLYTQGLPKLALLAPLLAPAPPPALQTAPTRTSSSPAPSNMIGLRLLTPREIPRVVNMLSETTPPPPVVDPSTLGISHGTGDPHGHGTVMDAIAGNRLVLPPPPPPAAHRPRISRMMEGNLIERVEPQYPPLAIQAHIQGRVLLRAVISRAGMIECLQLVSGHPWLTQAAIEAVSRWRYQPYLLNGELVEVETEVTVDFHFSKD
jgi:protein TonB